MKKEIAEYIEKNFDIVKSNLPDDEDGMLYVSKVHGSYIGRVGLSEVEFKKYLELGLGNFQSCSCQSNIANIAYSEKSKKWYGWSHRAFFGFGIGSKVSKGDCAYNPSCIADFIENEISFCVDEPYKKFHSVEILTKQIDGDPVSGVEISWIYKKGKYGVPNKSLHGKKAGTFIPLPKEFGKGEWVAKSIDDAKIMACDFAKGVS